MTEHLDAHQFAAGSGDVLFLNLSVNLGHLVEVQLARQHDDVGKLGVELQRLDVRYVQLRG